MIVAQLTDTHIVRQGGTYFGCDTARYLADAIRALQALEPRPDCVVVTGDLVNLGTADEYAHFERIMSTLAMPYYVVPGNHDDGDRLRDVLHARTFGDSREAQLRYAIDDFAVRIVGIDANPGGAWPGAALGPTTLEWLERTVTATPQRPTIVCVHHPPFRTGIHYLDAFGFRGARRLRAIVDRAPGVGRVISGHIHCVRGTYWRQAFVCSAPSTAPQAVPLLFMDGRVLGLRRERPGFSLHAWSAEAGFTTTVFRRDETGAYVSSVLPHSFVS